MKFLSLIFSIYFLALAVMPCSDEISVDMCQTVAEHNHYDQGHEEHAADLCTPFCMCHCCGGIAFNLQDVIQLAPLEYSTHENIYTSQFPAEISFSIWQPPKIS